MESGWERDIEFHEGWDFCLCCGSGGDCGESIVYKRVGVVGVLCIGVVERDCTGVIDILVLEGFSWWRWWREWNWWWGVL